jgi:hypothetical protein
VIPVFILKSLFYDETRRAFALHTFDNTETTSTQIEQLFPRVQLIGFLQLLVDAIEVCLFTRIPMRYGSHGDVQRTVTYRAYWPGLAFLRFVVVIPLVLLVIVLAHHCLRFYGGTSHNKS